MKVKDIGHSIHSIETKVGINMAQKRDKEADFGELLDTRPNAVG